MKKIFSTTTIVIYLLIILLYNVLYYLIPFNKTAAIWLTYGFFHLASVITVLITIALNLINPKQRLTSLVIFFIKNAYFVLQIILTIIIILISLVVNIPFLLVLILQIVLLVVNLILLYIGFLSKTKMDNLDLATIKNESFLKEFKNTLEDYNETLNEGVVKNSLLKLIDNVRYSDPVSNEATAMVENEINQLLPKLKESKAQEETIAVIDQLNSLLSKRNRLCKENKTN